MDKQQSVALRALQLMDLTSLQATDTDESIIALCKKAATQFGTTAAVCVFPEFVATAKAQLAKQGTPEVQVATVVNFPHGEDSLETVLAQTQAALEAGADEIDLVLDYRAVRAGDVVKSAELVSECKALCGERKLKVIIESGELKTAELIARASEIAIVAGADFIKTSTGKVAVNATLEAAEIMLNTIKRLDAQTQVGFKAAGGVTTCADAKQYIELAQQILGDNWVAPSHFRFGASGLLQDVLKQLAPETAQTGDTADY